MAQNDTKFRMILRSILSVPRYSGIFGQIFFSVIKKNSWHRWHSAKNRLEVLVLANNRCATALIFGGTAWHKWRIY